ncbi:2-dehydropantoate 2-reductase [Methylobacterium gnaphalii]|uniref:2-dehydropantoate 2-reductase n=1 Tax=Methylobacterium gnaphalii TaxID=1010610 RepID=A0A512JE25_9HYPH|nr:2-dehydropantoate 2-reductase [Methylobacterium gnaphalii]GEP08185.1 2-dehydropantoate 2-reductase [Methylobacterium gnaphalii]GJD68218.1 2-dehydropantoate 2-reductase [Methylobacterium gnaphalii]GLS51184.1 2-dehydropantoate 2-reductase [Methylobacterium gnaphalii]
MRVLVVGAGATGGYFGARLAQIGRDVTFLVRKARAEKLAAEGLQVRSPVGDYKIDAPQTVTADALAGAGPFDLVLLSCKAYDLDTAIADVAPAVGQRTAVLPILNGMKHLDVLDRQIGAERVLGGSCAIVATLTKGGEIRQMTELHSLTYGERDGSRSERIQAIEALMDGVRFQTRSSDKVLLEMWEKWVFLATLAGSTTLMRATIGDIVAAPGGRAFLEALHDECRAVAVAAGYGPREKVFEGARKTLTTEGSPMTASMLRDIEGGARIEADHIIGDLIARGDKAAPDSRRPFLQLVYTGLRSYQSRREREAS